MLRCVTKALGLVEDCFAVALFCYFPLLLLLLLPVLQWDAEVRDKALGLIEDFARGLPHPAYKEAYESLVVSSSGSWSRITYKTCSGCHSSSSSCWLIWVG
jgi:hypothetical protein